LVLLGQCRPSCHRLVQGREMVQVQETVQVLAMDPVRPSCRLRVRPSCRLQDRPSCRRQDRPSCRLQVRPSCRLVLESRRSVLMGPTDRLVPMGQTDRLVLMGPMDRLVPLGQCRPSCHRLDHRQTDRLVLMGPMDRLVPLGQSRPSCRRLVRLGYFRPSCRRVQGQGRCHKGTRNNTCCCWSRRSLACNRSIRRLRGIGDETLRTEIDDKRERRIIS
jgi:hypothetical protein